MVTEEYPTQNIQKRNGTLIYLKHSSRSQKVRKRYSLRSVRKNIKANFR
jgi:hypothetical protein